MIIDQLSLSSSYIAWNTFLNVHRLWEGSAILFYHSACYGEAAEQRLKKLCLIREVIDSERQVDLIINERICSYCTTELIKILELNHYQYDNNQRPYVGNYLYSQEGRGFFVSATNDEILSIIQAAPNAPDAVEAIVVYMEILLKMNIGSYNPIIEAYINSINKYSMVQSQHVRVMELHFKAKYNFRRFNSRVRELHSDYDPARVTYNYFRNTLRMQGVEGLQIERCIDSIYCLLEVLRITNTQRNDFMIGHSLTATVYKKLAWWGIVYRGLSGIEPNLLLGEGRYRRMLLHLINEQNEKIALFPKYNFEKAIGHYEMAIQTHKRGTPYKEMIHQLFALEDDLNDEFTHFMLALDRMRFVNGEFDDKAKNQASGPIKQAGEIEKTKAHLDLLIKEENKRVCKLNCVS